MSDLMKNMELMAEEDNCELTQEARELIECVDYLVDKAFCEGFKKGLEVGREESAEYAKTGREEME